MKRQEQADADDSVEALALATRGGDGMHHRSVGALDGSTLNETGTTLSTFMSAKR